MRGSRESYACRGGDHAGCGIYLLISRKQTQWCVCPCHWESTAERQSRQLALRGLYARPGRAASRPVAGVVPDGGSPPLGGQPVAAPAPAPAATLEQLLPAAADGDQVDELLPF